jgi:hypothetical protein
VAGSPRQRLLLCALDGVRNGIANSDGAFVGTVTDREVFSNQYAVVTFDCGSGDLRGRFGPVMRVGATQGSACGPELRNGERTGLLLT